MPETSAPEQGVRQLLVAGVKDIRSLLALRAAQGRSVESRRALESLVVELMENPTLDEQELSAERAALLIGVGQWALGRIEEALAHLVNASGGEAEYFRGLCFLETGFHQRAIEAFERAGRGKAAVKHLAALGLAEATAKAGHPDAAVTAARALAKAHPDEADVHYVLGLSYDHTGRYKDATVAYEKAIELDPDHGPATFRLGLTAARSGHVKDAERHYAALAGRGTTYANALLNLGVLYEDQRQFERAIECYRRVLRVTPNHTRARLFLKDAHASLDMVFDEDRQRELDRQSKLLAIPVSDFELSVRVRNCLQRMNIYTLGELVHHTEEELLASKNFGETSLEEIKEMLTARGLRLGQTREDLAEPVEAEEEIGVTAAPAAPVDDALLLTSIAELDLSQRSRKCMDRLGIATIGQLVDHTADELLASRNFGRTSLVEVAERLAHLGLQLQEPEPPPSEDAPEDEGTPNDNGQ